MTVTPLFHFSSSFAVMLHTSTFIALLVSLTILPSGIAAASIAKAAERMSAAGDEISEGEALKLLQAVTALDAYYRHRADASNNNKQQLQQPFIIPTAARFIQNTQHQQPIYAGQPMMKRSMALGRLEFRPGKRSGFAQPVQQAAFGDSMVPLEMLYATNYFRDNGHSFPAWVAADALRQQQFKQQQEDDEDAEAENNNKDLWWYAAEESAMGKRSAAAAKRSMAVGRSGFRPGKRSIATGREGFRPGK